MADADRNPTYLRDLAGHVADFRAAFESFLELHTPTWAGPARGVFPAVSPREGVDKTELETRRQRVSRAADGLECADDNWLPIWSWGHDTGRTGCRRSDRGVEHDQQPKPMLEPANIIATK